MTLISILIPTFNRVEYLPDCLESLISQTYKNWEAIIVSDGCTDSTPMLMDYYTNLDPRIKYIYRNENKGIAATRNEAFSHAKGEYIAVMDSDDLMVNERLARELKALGKAGVDIVYSSYLRANEQLEVIDQVTAISEVTKESILNNISAPHVTIMAKRKCFENSPYRNECRVNDDAVLLADWYKAGYRFTALKEPLVIVRFHAQSISATHDKQIKEVHKLVEEILK